jgi:hypothetical protein
VLAPAAAGPVLHHPPDENLSVGTMVELEVTVHESVFVFSFFGKFLLLPLFLFLHFVRPPSAA